MGGRGRWLTHGDFALGADVDFLAVVVHRLIPASVRGEGARLRCKKLASIWAPALQDASNVGHAGLGLLVCMVPLFRCLLLLLFSFIVCF